MSRLLDCTARHARHDERDRHDSHDTCSGASPQRGVGGYVHLTFYKSCPCVWCKSRAQKTKLVLASTTASSSSSILEQSRLDTFDTSYVSCRDVTWWAKYNLGFTVDCWVSYIWSTLVRKIPMFRSDLCRPRQKLVRIDGINFCVFFAILVFYCILLCSHSCYTRCEISKLMSNK